MSSSVSSIQIALQNTTEKLPTAAEYDDPPTPAGIFTPPSHIKALRLQTQLVIGARGVGKTFWTQALQCEATRKMLEIDIPELSTVQVSIGYSNKEAPLYYPGPKVCSSFLKSYDPIDIWRAVLLRALVSHLDCSVPSPFTLKNWEKDIESIANRPDIYDKFLYKANKEFADKGVKVLILFDALDRVAQSWHDIDALTSALLQIALQLSTYSNIKLKVFLREDHYNRIAFTFPDASKLLASRVDLSWKRAELYSLLWKYLCNGSGKSGQTLRSIFRTYIPEGLKKKENIWIFKSSTSLTDDTLRPIFHSLTGPFMGMDKRRGIPYVWTVGHLADARQQTSPRSFLAAIRRACEDSCENYPNSTYAIHYESIKRGVQLASEIRVNEMREDNPWAEKLLNLLQGINVPCSFKEVKDIWSIKYPAGPGTLVSKFPGHTPPEFERQNWRDVRDLLEKLGFCMTLGDGRFNMPDLYRVGFRLGRKGGVKPLP